MNHKLESRLPGEISMTPFTKPFHSFCDVLTSHSVVHPWITSNINYFLNFACSMVNALWWKILCLRSCIQYYKIMKNSFTTIKTCLFIYSTFLHSVQFSSVSQSCPNLWDPMDCNSQASMFPSPTPGAWSNSCPLSQWCHSTISSYVVPFSSHLQSFPASVSFQMSQFFASGV